MLKIKKLSLKEYALYSSVISLGIIFDQFTKWLFAFILKDVGNSIPIIKNIFHFTLVHNEGAAFGSFKDSRWVFMVTSTVMIVALGLYLYFGFAQNRLYAISVSMIISGGIGNMIDRIAMGYVVDFIDFRVINFAVFNVADSFVCVGAGLLALAVILEMKAETAEAKKKKKDEEEKDDI